MVVFKAIKTQLQHNWIGHSIKMMKGKKTHQEVKYLSFITIIIMMKHLQTNRDRQTMPRCLLFGFRFNCARF